MKAAVVETSRSDRLRAQLKTPRTPAPALDCPDQLQLYLNHLTALVPTAPKHRRLSKLEVIQCVIDYICDLEDTLLGRFQPAEELEEGEGLREAAEDQRERTAEDRTGTADQSNTVRTSQVSQLRGMSSSAVFRPQTRRLIACPEEASPVEARLEVHFAPFQLDEFWTVCLIH